MSPFTTRPEIDIAFDNTSFRQQLGLATRRRLKNAYTFTAEEVARRRKLSLGWVLDVGTYDGSFIRHLLPLADHVISFDIQLEKLTQAKDREELQ